MHFSHLVKVRKNSHSLSLQAFLTHSHSLSLSLAGLHYTLSKLVLVTYYYKKMNQDAVCISILLNCLAHGLGTQIDAVVIQSINVP